MTNINLLRTKKLQKEVSELPQTKVLSLRQSRVEMC